MILKDIRRSRKRNKLNYIMLLFHSFTKPTINGCKNMVRSTDKIFYLDTVDNGNVFEMNCLQYSL